MDDITPSLQSYGSAGYYQLHTESTSMVRSRCSRFCTNRCCLPLGLVLYISTVGAIVSSSLTALVILPVLQTQEIPIDYKLGLTIGIPLWVAITAIVGCWLYRDPQIRELYNARQRSLLLHELNNAAIPAEL